MIFVPNLSSVGCLGAVLESVTHRRTTGCQVKIELTQPWSAGARELVEQLLKPLMLTLLP